MVITITNTGVIPHPPLTAEQQINNPSLSAAQREIVKYKLSVNSTSMIKSNSLPRITSSPTWIKLSGFLCYDQDETYYCVPAAIKAALQYINDDSPEQDEIADAIGTTEEGTDFREVSDYLNDQQDRNIYVQLPPESKSQMANCFSLGISDYDSPPLFSATTKTANGWPHTLNLHTMCISGKLDDLSEFRVADPYVREKTGASSSFYTMSASNIYTGISSADDGALAY